MFHAQDDVLLPALGDDALGAPVRSLCCEVILVEPFGSFLTLFLVVLVRSGVWPGRRMAGC